MKCLPNIEFCEDFSATDPSEGLVDKRKGVPVFTSNCIQFPKVDTESKAAGRFLYEENRRSVRCLTCLYKAFFEVIEEVLLSCEQFFCTLAV